MKKITFMKVALAVIMAIAVLACAACSKEQEKTETSAVKNEQTDAKTTPEPAKESETTPEPAAPTDAPVATPADEPDADTVVTPADEPDSDPVDEPDSDPAEEIEYDSQEPEDYQERLDEMYSRKKINSEEDLVGNWGSTYVDVGLEFYENGTYRYTYADDEGDETPDGYYHVMEDGMISLESEVMYIMDYNHIRTHDTHVFKRYGGNYDNSEYEGEASYIEMKWKSESDQDLSELKVEIYDKDGFTILESGSWEEEDGYVSRYQRIPPYFTPAYIIFKTENPEVSYDLFYDLDIRISIYPAGAEDPVYETSTDDGLLGWFYEDWDNDAYYYRFPVDWVNNCILSCTWESEDGTDVFKDESDIFGSWGLVNVDAGIAFFEDGTYRYTYADDDDPDSRDGYYWISDGKIRLGDEDGNSFHYLEIKNYNYICSDDGKTYVRSEYNRYWMEK